MKMRGVSLIIELASAGKNPVVYVGSSHMQVGGVLQHPFAAAFFVFVYILMQIQAFVNTWKNKS